MEETSPFTAKRRRIKIIYKRKSRRIKWSSVPFPCHPFAFCLSLSLLPINCVTNIIFLCAFWCSFSFHLLPKQVALGQVKSRYLTNTNACCSQLTTDISKENKGRITTNTKLPISSYSKKEKPPSTLLLTRKKGKVLCDVIPTSSSSVPLTAKFNDLTQTQPIPNKRPKVVLSKKLPVNDDKLQETPVCDPCVDDELKIASTLVDSNSLTFIETSIPSTFDPDMPCCSHQAFSQALPSSASSTSAGLSFPKKLKKITRKIAPPTSATPSMAHKQVKKPLNALKLCNSIASVGTSTSSNSSMSNSSTTVGPSSLIRTTRRSSLSRDGRKLKKKKSLRAEATLKRKKSRVFWMENMKHNRVTSHWLNSNKIFLFYYWNSSNYYTYMMIVLYLVYCYRWSIDWFSLVVFCVRLFFSVKL